MQLQFLVKPSHRTLGSCRAFHCEFPETTTNDVMQAMFGGTIVNAIDHIRALGYNAVDGWTFNVSIIPSPIRKG